MESRSSLIALTYASLHSILSSNSREYSNDQLITLLGHRTTKLKSCVNPFGPPKAASRRKVESGEVTLEDASTLKIEDTGDKDYVWAISTALGLDEVDALVLLRSFLYNEGLPPTTASSSSVTQKEMEGELLDSITPFYFEERLSLIRILIPLFRAHASSLDPLHTLANDFLQKLFPSEQDKTTFVELILTQYTRRVSVQSVDAPEPDGSPRDPRKVAVLARQVAKEQLAMLELLFWATWSFVDVPSPSSSPHSISNLILKIFSSLYATDMGHRDAQRNRQFLLDGECERILEDISAMAVLVLLESLNLERVMESVADNSRDEESTWNSDENEPRAGKDAGDADAKEITTPLAKLHTLIMSRAHLIRYAPITIGWTLFLQLSSLFSLQNLPTLLPSNLPNPVSRPQLLAQLLSYSTYYAPDTNTGTTEERPGPFTFVTHILRHTSVFSTTLAWATASVLCDPGAVAYRSVIKGLLIATLEATQPEYMPNPVPSEMEECWIELFGYGESVAVAPLTRQFWDYDYKIGRGSRRGLLDIVRLRFPLDLSLVRFLGVLCGVGSTSTSTSTSAIDSVGISETEDEDTVTCASYVFHYMRDMQSFAMLVASNPNAIPGSSTDPTLGLSSIIQKRADGSSGPAGSSAYTYTTLRAMSLPGANVVPPNTVGLLLGASSTSDDHGDRKVIAWEHNYNGWAVLMEVLRAYVKQRTGAMGVERHTQVNTGRRIWHCSLGDVRGSLSGIQAGHEGESEVADILDLVRYVVCGGKVLAGALVESLEDSAEDKETVASDSRGTGGGADLVELATLVLEDALSRSGKERSTGGPTNSTTRRLVVSAINVLAGLLALPTFSTRVWLYLRSSSVLFGLDPLHGGPRTAFGRPANTILGAEKMTGLYPITHTLLLLLRALFFEFTSSLALTAPHSLAVKVQVLQRALRFIHVNVWCEFWRWRYDYVRDKFEIGRILGTIYSDILRGASPPVSSIPSTFSEVALAQGPLKELAIFVMQNFAATSTTTSLVPVIEVVASGPASIESLFKARRYADARSLIQLLEVQLRFTRMLLQRKPHFPGPSIWLLERLLCSEVPISTFGAKVASAVEPISNIWLYISKRSLNDTIPLEAVKLLSELCASKQQIYAHLVDPESMVKALVRIAGHPYDVMQLRYNVWSFACLCVESQPALASLLVDGKPAMPLSSSMEGDAKQDTQPSAKPSNTMLTVAFDLFQTSKELWDSNPQLLSAVVRFVNTAWERFPDHNSALTVLREDPTFWSHISSLASEDLGPPPDAAMSHEIQIDGIAHAQTHEATSAYAYRASIKAKSLDIISSDIRNHAIDSKKPSPSFDALEKLLKTEEQFAEHLLEGVTTSFDPTLHYNVISELEESFPFVNIESISLQSYANDREYGDQYLYPVPLLRERLLALRSTDLFLNSKATKLISDVYSINLNWSLTDAQIMLTKAWRMLLQDIAPTFRKKKDKTPVIMGLAASLSAAIAAETRSGPVVAVVHSERLHLLLAFLEMAWFDSSGDPNAAKQFITMVSHLGSIVTSQIFPPLHSLRNRSIPSYHVLVLRLVFYVAKKSRLLIINNDSSLRAEDRLTIARALHPSLMVVIESLRELFDAAREKPSSDVEADIQLYVSTFHQCILEELNLPTSIWLQPCRDLDLFHISLDLLHPVSEERLSLVSYILFFHLSLAHDSSSAEQLASHGALASYSRLPSDMPTETWCTVLSVVSSLISKIGYIGNFIELEVGAFIQVHGERIAQVLSWTIDDPITMTSLEELERVTELFYVLSHICRPFMTQRTLAIQILQAFTRPALALLQHLNYAFTHPNHLASLIESESDSGRNQLVSELPKDASYSLAELFDPSKKPVTAKHVQGLCFISNNVLSTLLTVSGASSVLHSHESEWGEVVHVLLVPHATVTLSETASIGSISELAGSVCDVLRHLSPVPPNDAEKKLGALAIQQLVETALTFTATQTVAWLNSPKPQWSGDHGGDMDVDELGHGRHAEAGESQSRRHSLSASLSSRRRKNMSGELAADITSLLGRCQSALDKFGVDKKANMASLLRGFLEERIRAA